MSAEATAWMLFVVVVALSVLLVIAVGGNADLAAENRRLKKSTHKEV